MEKDLTPTPKKETPLGMLFDSANEMAALRNQVKEQNKKIAVLNWLVNTAAAKICTIEPNAKAWRSFL